MPALVRPPAITDHCTVAIVATSSPIAPDELDRLVAYFRGSGHDVQVATSARTSTGYLAGTAEQRAADLMAAFLDPAVQLIVPATGGKGAAHLLPLLDYQLIAANPTVFTGMSDPSIICNALYSRAGLVSLHGPSGYDFYQEPVNPPTEDAFWHAVNASITDHEVKGDDWRVVRGSGTIRGRIVGGHLGTVRALVGTRYLPDLNGAILILEEVFVPWTSIDQALTHLRLAGVFDNVAALVVGVPIDCDRGDAPDADWDEMILRCVGGSMPVITNVEFGHTARKIPLPVGGEVEFDLAGSCPVLRYCESLVDAL
jgi:muramoyltetrapeptide carboxypeptidase